MILDQNGLTPEKLATQISALWTEPGTLASMAQAARSMALPQAGDMIARQINEWVVCRKGRHEAS